MCSVLSATPNWFDSHQYLALWLEGIALLAIFIWDRIDASQQHKQTLAQMEVMRIQAHATETAANAANKSADAANKNIEIVTNKERARLQIIAGNVPVVSNAAIGVLCHLNNVGPTMAFLEGGGMALVLTAGEITIDYARCVAIPLVGTVPANSRTPNEFLITLQPDPIITDAQALEIRERKLFIHCYGYVRYRDVFDRRWRVRLHLRWFMRFGGMIQGQIMEWWELAGTLEENSDTEDITPN